ncbi:MAG: hypothetical protein VX460_11730 [Planctomycetota bacterium]|nr:hypothetical protein [Planctomycetota bacterium]
MSEYGKQKSGRYAFAHTRIQEAMKAGFYLEAITITESMITDRLLASRDHLMGEERKGRRTLGALLQKHLNDEALRVEPGGAGEGGETIFKQLDRWREERNDLLHGIAKCLPGFEDKCETTTQLMERARLQAERGLGLFRSLDGWLRRERRLKAA